MSKPPNKSNPWVLFLKQSSQSRFFPQLTFASSDDKNVILFNTLFRLLRLNAPIVAFFRPVASWLLSKAVTLKNDNTVFNFQGQKSQCI